jgi:hypothetical protein
MSGARLGTAVPLALLAALALAGCAGAPGPHGHGTGGPGSAPPPERPALEPIDGPAPDGLPVAQWTPGASWSYRGSAGSWRNVTVLDHRERDGRDAYLVQNDRAPALAGVSRYYHWRDAERLALMVYTDGRETLEFGCAAEAIFPLADQPAQRCEVSGTTQDLPSRTVLGWASLAAPGGTLPVVEVGFDDGRERWSAWYAPDLGHYAAFHGTGAGGPRELFLWVGAAEASPPA